MDIKLAWEKYLQSGEVIHDMIKQPIVESWKRSNEASVNPFDGVCRYVLEHRQLKEVKERNSELLQTVKPLMEYCYDLIKETGVIFVLIDEQGYIMESFGDANVLEDAKRINFIQGATWTENQVGTNAIGTSLQIKKPINVTGAEHYCQKHHPWTCSAAPILDPAGKLLGIIDISGPARTFHKNALGLAAGIANTAMTKLILKKKGQEMSQVDKRFSLLFNNVSDGIIEVDARGVIKRVNPAVNRLFKMTSQEMIGRPVEELFGWDIPPIMSLLKGKRLDCECSWPAKNESKKFLLCGESIIDAAGAVAGGIIIFKRLDEQKVLVKRAESATRKDTSYHFADIKGDSPAIVEAVQIARLAARSFSNVLLQGECGTGKEIFAQAIHNESARKEGPFIAVNCGAIPRDLIGSELFGYEEGAFTGARRGGRAGKFEIASGGTLFLDEVGDMPFEQQVALLRVLQEKKVVRIGGHREIPVDVRVICATNRNLSAEVVKGNFRQDLYYRLNVITINIPPLRERREDIILLFHHFLKKHESARGWSFEIEPQVFDYLQKYHWPGNVRELENVVERLINLTQDRKIKAGSLPAEIRFPREFLPRDAAVEIPVFDSYPVDRKGRKRENAKLEQQKIIYVLNRHHGNVSKAASELGVSRNTLYRKMRLYNINN
jgi:transcriptional regulator of acetoin/glycerol metabolism